MSKQKNNSRTRVGKNTGKGGFKFRWWMGALLVAVVAVIGIYVIYTSRASGRAYTGTVQYFNLSQGGATVYVDGFGPLNFVRYPGNNLNSTDQNPNGIPGWSQDYKGWCATIQKGFKGDAFTNIRQGDKVFVTVYDTKNAQSCYGHASVN
jgi:hypothetical protein